MGKLEDYMNSVQKIDPERPVGKTKLETYYLQTKPKLSAKEKLPPLEESTFKSELVKQNEYKWQPYETTNKFLNILDKMAKRQEQKAAFGKEIATKYRQEQYIKDRPWWQKGLDVVWPGAQYRDDKAIPEDYLPKIQADGKNIVLPKPQQISTKDTLLERQAQANIQRKVQEIRDEAKRFREDNNQKGKAVLKYLGDTLNTYGGVVNAAFGMGQAGREYWEDPNVLKKSGWENLGGTLKAYGKGAVESATGKRVVQPSEWAEGFIPDKELKDFKNYNPALYNFLKGTIDLFGVDDLTALGLAGDIAKLNKLYKATPTAATLKQIADEQAKIAAKLTKVNPKIAKQVAETLDTKVDDVVQETSPERLIRPNKTMHGTYRVKNTDYEYAMAKYEDAVETLRNKYQTDDIQGAVDDIVNGLGAKNRTPVDWKAYVLEHDGIDMDKLIDDVARAAELTPKQIMERARMATVAGVMDPKTAKLLDDLKIDATILRKNKVVQLPKIEAPKVLDNVIPMVDDTAVATNRVAARADDLPMAVGDNVGLSKVDDMSTPAIKTTKQEFREKVDSLLAGSDSWKDKKRSAYIRETPVRNIEDVAGKDAQAIITEVVDPIQKNESNSIRYINDSFKKLDDTGVKAYTQDSALLQQYGEKVITLDQLKQQTKNWEKIEAADKVYRQVYDEALAKMNAALVRNGYPPVPKRQDYYMHMQEMTSAFEKIGIPVKDYKLPTEIAGLTENFKPGKAFFRSALRRKGNKTAFDAVVGIEKYLHGASRVIHHTDDIQRLRTLSNAIRKKYKGTNKLSNLVIELDEYANILAGKQAGGDRSIEKMYGRTPLAVLDFIKNKTGLNAVAGNISVALTNFIPYTQALATTNKISFLKGMLQTIVSKVKNDGFAEAADFLVRKRGTEKLAKKTGDKIAEKASWLFKSVDNFVSETVIRGKYDELISKGLDPETAMKQANDYAARLIGDRSLGAKPSLFNSKLHGPITQFQFEINNQLSYLFKDMPKTYSKAKLIQKYTEIAIYSYLFNNMYEKLTGRRVAIDPIYIIGKSVEEFSGDDIDDAEAAQRLMERVVDQIPFASVVTGGRVPVLEPFKDASQAIQNNKNVLPELGSAALTYLLPAGGSQIKKTVGGIQDLNLLGNQTIPGSFSGEKLKYPIKPDATNILRGLLFGRYSFPETREYYDKNYLPLGKSQTKQVQISGDPLAEFKKIRERQLLERKK
jgi:hypothetical protein